MLLECLVWEGQVVSVYIEKKKLSFPLFLYMWLCGKRGKRHAEICWNIWKGRINRKHNTWCLMRFLCEGADKPIIFGGGGNLTKF